MPSPTCPTIGASKPRLLDVPLGLGDAFGQAGDRHADIGRHRHRPRAADPPGPIGVVPRLPKPRCGPRAWTPIRTALLRTRRRCRRNAGPVRRPRPACHGIRGTAWKSRADRAWNAGCRRAPAISSRSSMRATGMPDWIVMITASQAALIDGKGQMPPAIASGMPKSFSVSSVMTPSVPSAPTKSRVRS